MEQNKYYSNNVNHDQQESTYEQEKSTSVLSEACIRELNQLISVTLESSQLDLRKLQQAANDFRLCAKTFKICDVKLHNSCVVNSDNNKTS
ncbi:hypothetical protein GpartN1_g2465.t1 [Galdieria partita]|uniref:Uncharacterized protein n=1 Tax=Galdieria partita TaxID=83374 RepID=A0A9C7UP89_9RHOD|nr:hypothetical protein GpartN1_g2465.t1 [Galdieria partita]